MVLHTPKFHPNLVRKECWRYFEFALLDVLARSIVQ